MAVQSHIESLQERHQQLQEQLDALMVSASSNDQEIIEIKRQKLVLKDRIAELSRRSYA